MTDNFEPCTIVAHVGHGDVRVRLGFRDQRMGSYRLGLDTDQPVLLLEQFRVTVTVEDETTSYEAVIEQVHQLHDVPEGLLVCRIVGEGMYFTLKYEPVVDESQPDWEAGTGILHMSRREFQALMPGQQLTALGYGF